MSGKADYAPEEWDQLTGGPIAAAMYVIMSSPSLLGMFSEVNAMLRSVQSAATGVPPGSLLSAILADLDQSTIKHRMNELKPRSGADQTASLAGLVEATRSAGAVVAAKGSADESRTYREFVLGVADKVAEAAKDEGQQVGPKELAALGALRDALGTSG